MVKVLMLAYTNYTSDARPRREAEALVSRGDSVDFIALAEHHQPAVEMINGVRLFRLPLYRYRGGSTMNYLFAYGAFFFVAFLKVTVLFIKNRYTVVQVHTMPDCMVFAAVVPKLFSAGIILDMHDAMPELYATKFGVSMHHWLIRLILFQERASAIFADHVLVVHEPHRRLLISHGVPATKITSVLNVPDDALFVSQLKYKNNHPTVVYHGTLARRLGLDIALQAFALVKKKIPGVMFNIYGDGDFLKELQRMVQDLHLENEVYLSGRMHAVQDIPMLIGNADLAIVPNRKDAFTEKMLPVKLLEYVVLGVPVVISRTSAVEEYFHDSLRYVEPENVEDLAAAMTELLSNEQLSKTYVTKAREFYKTYNWQQQKQIYYSIVDKVGVDRND